MQQHNLAGVYKRYVAMRRKNVDTKHYRPTKELRRAEINHVINYRGLAASGNTPEEVPHVLLDYRNDNKQLARLVLNRREAYNLNQRLKGTGMAFAAKGGY